MDKKFKTVYKKILSEALTPLKSSVLKENPDKDVLILTRYI